MNESDRDDIFGRIAAIEYMVGQVLSIAAASTKDPVGELRFRAEQLASALQRSTLSETQLAVAQDTADRVLGAVRRAYGPMNDEH